MLRTIIDASASCQASIERILTNSVKYLEGCLPFIDCSPPDALLFVRCCGVVFPPFRCCFVAVAVVFHALTNRASARMTTTGAASLRGECPIIRPASPPNCQPPCIARYRCKIFSENTCGLRWRGIVECAAKRFLGKFNLLARSNERCRVACNRFYVCSS